MSAKQFLGLWGPERISTFVSIGANDGITNDPIYDYVTKFGWQGVMVEPDPSNFVRLEANFARYKGVALENVGIAAESGHFAFYYLNAIEESEPDWYSQVASFDRETFFRNIEGVPALMGRVGITSIETTTFEMLLAKHSMSSVDLLLLDTEGYDARILSSIDLRAIRPMLIVFEHEWLTTHDTNALLQRLRTAGYDVLKLDFDYIAMRRFGVGE